MTTFRHLLTVAGVAAVAWWSSSAVVAGSGTPSLAELAADAVEALAEEQQLVTLAAEPGRSAADGADAHTRLRTVDRRGAHLLAELEAHGAEITPPMRTALSLLPAAEPGSSPAPPRTVYRNAIDDLLRLTTQSTRSESRIPSLALLAVGAAALLALGSAALVNTLRRPGGTDDLFALAWSDGLTGLANRRRLDRDLDAHEGVGGETAVIMVDIDHFKLVNDTYGHQAGDEALQRVGALLSHHVRRDDVVYRYGGEEFCILLPDTDVDEAQEVADRLVAAAHELTLPDGAHLTLSVGVAGTSDGRVADALHTADLAMLRAKETGRDRAIVAESVTVGDGDRPRGQARSTRPR